jgi:hypothetical protein
VQGYIQTTRVLNFVKLHESNVSCVLLIAVCISTKTNIKHKMLSLSEKLEMIKKVDAQPHVTCTKVAEQLSIPMST